MVYSTRRFVLRPAFCYFVFVFLVLLALRLPRLGKRELILVLFIRLFDFRLFGFVCFPFLFVSGVGCGLRFWHSLDFSLTFSGFVCLCWGTTTSNLVGHFVSSPREREKRDRIDSGRDEREGQGRKRNRNESEETEEIKTFPLYPYLLQGQQALPHCKPVSAGRPSDA